MERRKRRLREMVTAARDQCGVALIDTVVALALLGVFGVVFLSAISTSTITMAGIEDKVNVDNLARAQMEYTKNTNSCPYDSVPPYDYQALDQLNPGSPYAIAVPSGYSINVTAAALHDPDDGIQEITVTIYRNGNSLLVTQGYKVDR
ncbi:MAG: hypothetical protein PHV74_15150 [Dehalococcoidia bacterium]|nr:hypothetical protein [Dehalococcoidia bacterium]